MDKDKRGDIVSTDSPLFEYCYGDEGLIMSAFSLSTFALSTCGLFIYLFLNILFSLNRYTLFSQNGQCSWMEMHQYIGDLLTSGNASKDQPDVLSAVWGVPASDDTLGFKGATLELLQPPIRPVIRDKPEAESLRRNLSGGLQRKEESRDKREGQSSPGSRLCPLNAWEVLVCSHLDKGPDVNI